MKINKLLAVGVIATSVISCGKQLKTTSSLATEVDSVSYAVGANMGQQMRINGKEINADLFIQGYLNGRDSSSLLIPLNDTRGIINKYFQKKQMEKMEKMQKEQAERAEKEFGEYKKEGEKFLAENKTKEGVKTTSSGLQYIVLREGEGESPKVEDRVKVHYHGTLTDGTVFDSSVRRGEPSEFGLNQVIKGWTEGLQLMKPGAKYKFFIPQELAYGSQQKGDKIKPFSPLVFEVELIEIQK